MSRARAIFTGAVGGFTSGLTGIGGGTVMVPLLTALLRLSQHRAHATSLVIVIFAAAAAVVPYVLDARVDWGLAAGLTVGGVVGAQIGARTMRALPERRLRLAFAVFLLLVGLRLLVGLDLEGHGTAPVEIGVRQLIQGGLIGLVGGAFGGLLGVGGGTLYVPAMVLILREPQHIAQGVSLVAIVPTAISATVTNVRGGYVDRTVAMWVTPFAVVLAAVGGTLAVNLPGDMLTRIFGLVVLYVGGRTLYSTWRAGRAVDRASADAPGEGAEQGVTR
jgi:uncharacterized protein